MAFLRKRGSELPPGRCAYNCTLAGLVLSTQTCRPLIPWQCRPTGILAGTKYALLSLSLPPQIFSSLVRVLSDRAQGRGSHAGCACLKKQPLLLQILLNYLPPERKAWKDLLEQKRAAYKQFRQELIIDPKKQEASAAADHPLSQSSSSKWNAFFKVGFYSGSATGKPLMQSLAIHPWARHSGINPPSSESTTCARPSSLSVFML